MILLAAFLGIVSCAASKSKLAGATALLLILSLVVQVNVCMETVYYAVFDYTAYVTFCIKIDL